MSKVVSYLNLQRGIANEPDKQKRLQFLYGQLNQLEREKNKLIISHYDNLKLKINTYISMIKNNKKLDQVEKFHKSTSVDLTSFYDD